MKAKLQGKKPTSTQKDEVSGVAVSKSVSVSSTKPAAPAAKAAPSVKEKPTVPVISEQSLQHFYAEPLPSFRDVAPSEKQLLFVQKLHLCSFTFDFTDPSKNVKEKEIKRQTLLELVDYANSGQGKFTEAVSEDIIFMLSQNLFRTLPPSRSHDIDNFDPEEEEPTLEPSWPHLQVIARSSNPWIASW
jgi:serine/threonine-protein phosphatase 2A regulatory subunit B'